MYIINFIRGFLMATADSVPGVSGGTIAFVLGFYDKFIGSINDLISGSKEERIEAITFLAKIGVGWIVGLVLSVLFIASIFEEHIYSISSVFLGLDEPLLTNTNLHNFWVWTGPLLMTNKKYAELCRFGNKFPP